MQRKFGKKHFMIFLVVTLAPNIRKKKSIRTEIVQTFKIIVVIFVDFKLVFEHKNQEDAIRKIRLPAAPQCRNSARAIVCKLLKQQHN